jgi:HEPN domain-containing protein
MVVGERMARCVSGRGGHKSYGISRHRRPASSELVNRSAWLLEAVSEQAVEKALKAVLVACGIEIPYTHDLSFLLEILVDRAISVVDSVGGAAWLTPWAVAARYGMSPAALDRPAAVAVAADAVAWAEAETSRYQEVAGESRPPCLREIGASAFNRTAAGRTARLAIWPRGPALSWRRWGAPESRSRRPKVGVAHTRSVRSRMRAGDSVLAVVDRCQHPGTQPVPLLRPPHTR